MNGLLLSLPGTPVLYYGDEIGMGDNFYLGDRNGVRTPMQWSPDRNAGFSRANSQRLYLPVIIDPEYHYEAVNVEVQQDNPQSLLWWMKRILSLRKQCRAFGRGSLEFLYPENSRILAFVRRYEDETVLVVANLSRFAQHVELNLASFKGLIPVEMFGTTPFPPVGDGPYPLALGPHTFYWFALKASIADPLHESPAEPPPTILWSARLEDLLGEGREILERALPAILRGRPWFAGSRRVIQTAEVVDCLPITDNASLLLVRTEYTEGEAETYALTLAWSRPGEPDPAAVLARLVTARGDAAGTLYEPVHDRRFCEALLELMARRGAKGEAGEIEGWCTKPIRKERRPDTPNVALAVTDQRTTSVTSNVGLAVTDQRTTSITFGSRFVLRLLRRLEEGLNSEIEVTRFLTERAGFAHTPSVLGALDYKSLRETSTTIGFLHGFVPHEGDAWRFTQDELGRYFERVLAGGSPVPARAEDGLVALAGRELPREAREQVGSYLDAAALLGQRTAELHLALASDPADPAFAPEPYSALYQRSLVQSMRNLTRQVLQRLRRHLRALPESARADAHRVLQLEGEIVRRMRFDRPFTGFRTRYHGSHHLGQVLYTGKDFVLIAFEGEPGRSLADRRIKRSPLRDVASMIRSFHYVTAHVLGGGVTSGSVRPEDLPALEPWGQSWRLWVSVAFLKRYLETAAGATFLPAQRDELQAALDGYRLAKALSELGFELERRPDWVRIPLQGILELVQ